MTTRTLRDGVPAAGGVDSRRQPGVDPWPLPGVWLGCLLTLSVALRLGSAVYQGNTVTDQPGVYDQLSYHALGLRVADGHGFSFREGHWPATPAGEPTAHWSFLYTGFLAGVYLLVGPEPIVARLTQAVVAGILHPWLAYRVAQRIFGSSVATIAAVFSALYVYFVYYAGALVTETFYFLGILWTLDAAFRTTDNTKASGAWHRWIELGMAIGITGLLRQVFLLFVPVLFTWLLWSAPQRSTSLGAGSRWPWRHPVIPGLGVSTLVVLLLVSPWTLRNYRAFGTVVPLNTNAGFALFWGNHPLHGTRFQPLLEADGLTYAELIPADLRSLNEGQLDRALMREALQLIAADPLRFTCLSMSRSTEYFKFWPSRDSSAISNLARVGSFGLLLPLMIHGIWRSARMVVAEPGSPRAASILLLHAFVAVYAAVHLASWTLIRYRLPIDTLLVIFAALGASLVAARFGWVGRNGTADYAS